MGPELGREPGPDSIVLPRARKIYKKMGVSAPPDEPGAKMDGLIHARGRSFMNNAD